MNSITPSQATAALRSRQLLAGADTQASAGLYQCPERRQGGRRGRAHSLAFLHRLPSQAAQKLGRKLSDRDEFVSPETRGSQRNIIVGMGRLGKADLADNDPHGSSPSASLHVLHREDGRGVEVCPTKVFPVPENWVPKT